MNTRSSLSHLLQSVLRGVMKGSWGGFRGPQSFQSSCKLHEHKILFYLSVLYERSCPALGRINCIDVLGMLNALPLSLLSNAVENLVDLFFAAFRNRHISSLPGVVARFAF